MSQQGRTRNPFLKSGISIEKPDKNQMQCSPPKINKNEKPKPSGMTFPQGTMDSSNMVEDKFFFELKGAPVEGDQTIALELHLTPLPGERKRYLDLDSFTTNVLHYAGSDFPEYLGLYCLELDGFLNNFLQPTHLISYS